MDDVLERLAKDLPSSDIVGIFRRVRGTKSDAVADRTWWFDSLIFDDKGTVRSIALLRLTNEFLGRVGVAEFCH